MSFCSLTGLRVQFVKHLSLTQVAQQSVTRIISMTFIIVITPKAGARCELLFNKLASDLLKKSCLTAIIGVTKFTTTIAMNSVMSFCDV